MARRGRGLPFQRISLRADPVSGSLLPLIRGYQSIFGTRQIPCLQRFFYFHFIRVVRQKQLPHSRHSAFNCVLRGLHLGFLSLSRYFNLNPVKLALHHLFATTIPAIENDSDN